MIRFWLSLLTTLVTSFVGEWVAQAPSGDARPVPAVRAVQPSVQQAGVRQAAPTPSSHAGPAPRKPTKQRPATSASSGSSASSSSAASPASIAPPTRTAGSAHPLTDPPAPEVYAVPQGEVALTIDDGPSPYTEEILDILRRYHVNATFFFIGNRVALWPDAVRDAAADGNVIGDHSVDHRNLTQLSPTEQQWEIVEGAHLIQQVVSEPIRLFRPPYETMPNELRELLGADHMALALWNRDPRDWAASAPEDVIRQVVNGQPSGGVFDLHETRVTVEALPTIIQELQQRGLRLVTLTAPDGVQGILPVPSSRSGSAAASARPDPKK